MPIHIARNRQCTQCDTYNSPGNPICMVCDLPMPHAAKARTRTADALDLTAEATDWIGWMTFSAVNILTASDALLHGTGVTLDDVMPGLAAYGAARIAVFFLETAAEQTRPDWTVTRTPGGDYR